MKRLLATLTLVTLALAAVPLFAAGPQSVSLTASDGVKVWAYAYKGQGGNRPLILLFHQAGSNHAEYSTIAPRLVEAGYDCLALDQRSGGKLFGSTNETAKALGRNADYIQALPDLEAALAWAGANGYTGRVTAWGSSYSAALVFLLAARHPGELSALLAFSPGEYLGAPRTVRDAAAKVTVPVFVTSASSHDEVAAAKEILDATSSTNKRQFEAKSGVHGSSTLRSDRNASGANDNWTAVLEFLSQASAPRH